MASDPETPNPEDSLLDDVFVSLQPPGGGLEAVRARLRARQQRRVVGGGLALAAMALVAVLPALRSPPLPPDWQEDVAVATVAAPGMQVVSRGAAALEEVGRTEEVLLVRILAPAPPP